MLISKLKESNLAAELYLMQQRWRQPESTDRVVMFTSQIHAGSAGDLRARAVGRELKRLGWRVTVAPPQLDLAGRQRLIARERPTVIFLQQSRHPLNRPRLYAGVPCVFDADDADFHGDPETVAECCRDSRAVIAGSRYLAEFFGRHNSDVTVIWTGTYLLPSRNSTPNAKRAPVIAWAQTDPVDYPEEAAFVREVLLALAREAKFSFRLYGVRDEAAAQEYLAPLRQAGIEATSFRLMRYLHFSRSLEEVAVGLQPLCCAYSQGKNFGKLLAYMVSGVAVVVANASEYPAFFRHGENALLARSIDEWVASCKLFLDEPERRGQMAERAALDLRDRLSTRTAAEMVSAVLKRAATK